MLQLHLSDQQFICPPSGTVYFIYIYIHTYTFIWWVPWCLNSLVTRPDCPATGPHKVLWFFADFLWPLSVFPWQRQMSDIRLAASTAIWWTRWGINLNFLSGRTVNSLRLRRNRHYKADDIFKCIFLKRNVWIPTKISLKFVPKGPINNIPALVQRMAWRRPGDKPLS